MIRKPLKHKSQQASRAFICSNLHGMVFPHFINNVFTLNGALDAVCVAKDNDLKQLKGAYKDDMKINTVAVKSALELGHLFIHLQLLIMIGINTNYLLMLCYLSGSVGAMLCRHEVCCF